MNCISKIIFTLIFCLTFSTVSLAEQSYEDLENTFTSPMLNSDISYPLFVNEGLNLEILKFINNTFITNYSEAFNFFSSEQEFIKSNLEAGQSLADNKRQYELGISYDLSQVGDLVSILWIAYTYTGGAHGNMELSSLVYDSKEQKVLGFKDIFSKSDEALILLSELCPKYIEKIDYEFDLNGFGADNIANFSTFTLHPNFIRISFQPYQIAPWSAGLLSCDIPLKELEKVINKKYL